MTWNVVLLAVAVVAVALVVPIRAALADRGAAAPAPGDPPAHAPASAAATIEIVDALKAVAGNPHGVRASFARGQCVSGTYTPAATAARITRSASFTRPSEIVGRFSVGGGNPAVADTSKAVLRGFSFRLGPEGQTSDLLVESAPMHFARSVEQMLAFLQARLPGPDGKPDHDKVKAFSEANPETARQASYVGARPLPGSYAGVTYWGVHSFPATDGRGVTRFIKFKVVPVGGEVTLSDDEARARPADFLARDLEQRIADGRARLDVLAIVGRPGDPTLDVTTRWPDEDGREAVRLGTITITAMANAERCDAAIFDAGNLADGLGAPPDEMFAARRHAYVLSLERRRAARR